MDGVNVKILTSLLLAIPFAIAGLAYWINHAGRISLDRIVEETISQSETDSTPLVNVSFCAYRSCIIFWIQTEYRMALPYDTARLLLRRLHYYTLRWGWLGPAAIVIPWSFLSYAFERHSLRRQHDEGRAVHEAVVVKSQETTVFTPLIHVPDDFQTVPLSAVSKEPRSRFRLVVGWTCVGLCIMFAACGILCLVQKQFDAAIGSIVAVAVFGWTARDWIRKGRGY
jgi:hypothetical protein